MKTPRPVHPSQPFQFPHLPQAMMYKSNRLHLFKRVHQLLMQVVAVLHPRSPARSREGAPPFASWDFRSKVREGG